MIMKKTKDLNVTFSEFNLLTEDEVEKIITKSASRSCSLDPIPIWKLKKCHDLLVAIIALIINQSLRLGCCPCTWKCPLTIPLL